VPDKPRVRGILPVPRNIFKGRGTGKGLDKATDERIDLATKEPQERRATAAPLDLRLVWKEKMADARRRNLREGLQALRDRKVRTDKFERERATTRQADREALLYQPQREDERLTDPTLDPAIRQYLRSSILPDPNRQDRVKKMREKVEDKEEARKREREEALHTLYMQARDFITTEAQLDQAVDNAFGTPEDPRGFGSDSYGPSMWDHGPPATVQDLLNRANRGGTSVLDSSKSYVPLTKQRVQRMAEDLTGGKMDDS